MTDQLRKAAEIALEWMESTHHTAMTTYSDEGYEEHCKVEKELRQALAQQALADSIRPKGKSITKVWVDEINQALNVDTINTSKTCVDETEKREHEPAENITETVCSLLRKAHDILSMSSLPPKREWVSLTDEDITEAFVRMRRGLGKYTKFAQIIEAKLKEKNNG